MADAPIIIRCNFGMGEITIPTEADTTTLLRLRQQGADIQARCVGPGGPNIYMCKCDISKLLNKELPKPSTERL